jgi:hypothetical protein
LILWEKNDELLLYLGADGVLPVSCEDCSITLSDVELLVDVELDRTWTDGWTGYEVRVNERVSERLPSYSDEKVADRTVNDFGWEIAHEAVSRRPPIPLYTILPVLTFTRMSQMLGCVHRSRAIFCRSVPNPRVTIRFSFFRRCTCFGMPSAATK